MNQCLRPCPGCLPSNTSGTPFDAVRVPLTPLDDNSSNFALNAEALFRVDCTEIITSLDKYTILATVTPVSRRSTNKHRRGTRLGGAQLGGGLNTGFFGSLDRASNHSCHSAANAEVSNRIGRKGRD